MGSASGFSLLSLHTVGCAFGLCIQSFATLPRTLQLGLVFRHQPGETVVQKGRNYIGLCGLCGMPGQAPVLHVP